MINYFASAFRTLQIAHFAMKNQNPQNIYFFVAKCLLNFEVLNWLKDNNIVKESFTEISLFLGFFEET